MTSRTASHGWIFPLNAILTPADYDDNQRKPGKHARPKGHHFSTRRCRKAVKGGLNEGLEIPYFLRGEIGRGYSGQSESASACAYWPGPP